MPECTHLKYVSTADELYLRLRQKNKISVYIGYYLNVNDFNFTITDNYIFLHVSDEQEYLHNGLRGFS